MNTAVIRWVIICKWIELNAFLSSSILNYLSMVKIMILWFYIVFFSETLQAYNATLPLVTKNNYNLANCEMLILFIKNTCILICEQFKFKICCL